MSGRHVLVVGGGASGAIVAAHLLRDGASGVHVTIIEPSERLGHGLAYGTGSPSHLLNARARSMSAFDDRPADFADWLARSFGGAHWAERYVERRLYGRYLEGLLRPWHGSRLTHIRAAAVNLAEQGEGVRVDLDNGASVVGQGAVLAVGHGLRPAPLHGGRAAPDGDVLILGTGLGMVDEVLSLEDAGHRGRILALSRRGQLPQPHGPRREMRLDAADIPFGTHLSWLMRWLRAEARGAVAWQDLIDAVRPHVPEVWASLPPDARRRFLRHARPWWDSHRHRMAPSVARRIAAALDDGRLEVVAGRVIEQVGEPGGATLAWRPRGSNGTVRRRFAEVVDCTGPRQGPIARDPLLGALILSGVARPDAFGIGIEVSPTLRVRTASGAPHARGILAIGPITGALGWETYAVPEIRRQCARVADELAAIAMAGASVRRRPFRYAPG